MRHLFILDPKDFEHQWKADSIYDIIGQYFRTQVKPDFSTQTPRYPRETIGHIQKQVDEAKEGDMVRVYAIGSEAILFDCVNGIAEIPNADLAIMPNGLNNDFLRLFGESNIPLFNDLPTMASAPVIPTDIIRAGNIFALNVCLAGLTAATTKKTRDTKLKKRTTSFYFIRAFMTAISNLLAKFSKKMTAHDYTVTIDGGDYSGNYINICIANGRYYNEKKIAAAKAMPNDGLLDVTLLKAAGPLATMFSLLKSSRGKIPSNGIAMQAKKITIKSAEPFWVQIDQEFVQDTNITFEVVPGAVKIVAPGVLAYPQ